MGYHYFRKPPQWFPYHSFHQHFPTPKGIATKYRMLACGFPGGGGGAESPDLRERKRRETWVLLLDTVFLFGFGYLQLFSAQWNVVPTKRSLGIDKIGREKSSNIQVYLLRTNSSPFPKWLGKGFDLFHKFFPAMQCFATMHLLPQSIVDIIDWNSPAKQSFAGKIVPTHLWNISWISRILLGNQWIPFIPFYLEGWPRVSPLSFSVCSFLRFWNDEGRVSIWVQESVNQMGISLPTGITYVLPIPLNLRHTFYQPKSVRS